MAVKPLMLKQIGQSFDSFHDPLEIHGASMSRVIVLEKDSQARVTDMEKSVLAHDQETKRADEAEAKLKEIQTTAEASAHQRFEEALANFEDTPEYKLAAGKDTAYCLFEFVSTYKDETPSLLANYQEFIQPTPQLGSPIFLLMLLPRLKEMEAPILLNLLMCS
ncbi:hypothetical protein LIER_26011 [Lithospermum erythrorhizon]|uniref:Uncharacterized protein n=1 Tax=Lithospermum erythrorhizon TaxID=34254 RepID=A0AAV3R8D6_LITER